MGLRVLQLDAGAAEGALSASFLQSAFWGEFKSEYGWRSLRFELELVRELELSERRARILVLVRRLPAGFSFAYVPHGPEIELPETERAPFLAQLSKALRPFLPRRCLFIRFDPPWFSIEALGPGSGDEASAPPPPSRGAEESRPRIGRPLRRAAADVQPPDTVLVDLRASEEGILSAMKPKWRYNIRLAEKKGVVVEEGGVEAIPEFYELYRATALRDRIALHPEEYYRRLFTLAAERRRRFPESRTPDLRLWIARHEGRALAAIVTLWSGERGTYLYGASSDEKRNLMPAYALQWAAMRAAKAAGCLQYDLFGIPPDADPGHPMAGLYRFKTGFGGEIAHRAGSWDYPLAAFAYACFRAAEGARTWWFKDFMKRLKKARRSE
jgi:lipid II:glycine glycyltransferase (peptidoglycan interpeptide bridge formation enzyme)